jgi:hypothetical protein
MYKLSFGVSAIRKSDSSLGVSFPVRRVRTATRSIENVFSWVSEDFVCTAHMVKFGVEASLGVGIKAGI